MTTTSDDKRLMDHDLTFCGRCGAEAIAWAPGPLGEPEGRCAAHHVPAVADVPESKPAGCYLCGRPPGVGKRECRPYGPGGALLCAGCMFGDDDTPPDPEVQAEASRQFAARTDAIEASGHDAMVGEGFEDGPLPTDLLRKRRGDPS